MKVPRPEHPEPMLERETWLNLNGRWHFSVDWDRRGREEQWYLEPSLEDWITVPFPPESRLSGIGCTEFMPSVWYSREFHIPPDMRGGRILLHFGACDYETSVWINGFHIGSHVGGYTPFSFEVDKYLVDGKNVLVVEARDDNRTGIQPCGKQSQKRESYGCRYTRVTGIWQTVWLERVGCTYIKNLCARATSLDDPAAIQVTAELVGTADEIVIEASYQGSIVAKASSPCNQTSFLTLRLDEPKLWSPTEPNLYELEAVVLSEGRVVDRVNSYMGLRSIAIRGDTFLINGSRIFQRLVLDQGYYPEGIYTAPSDQDLLRDIKISKDLGFNGARLHQKVFEPRFLYWADKEGYLVWEEYPSWGIDLSLVQARENLLSEWIDVLRRDRNHPCIIGWCPLNETPVDQPSRFLSDLYKVTKMIDPTRPIIDTSGYTHVVTDVYDSHDYDQNVEAFRRRHDGIWREGKPFMNHPGRDVEYSGQPVMVSEFGGIWWDTSRSERGWGYGERPKSEEEFMERYAGLVDSLLDNPKLVGFCYTQLYDIEQEVNGLYTYERKPKFDAEKIRRINSRQAAYETSAEVPVGGQRD